MSWQPETPGPWGPVLDQYYFNFSGELDLSSRYWAPGDGAVQESGNALTTTLPDAGNDLTQLGLLAADYPVFNNQIWVAGDMQIVLTQVPEGTHALSLYFRELEHTSAGQRVYNSVIANLVTFETGFDPYQYGLAIYGQANAAIELVQNVTVASDGLVTIDLKMGAGNAAICGLYIRPGTATVARTDAYLNFYTAHSTWENGESYWTSDEARQRTASPNVGIGFQGDVTLLDPPLLATDQFLVEQANFQWPPGPMTIEIPLMRPGSYTVGWYFAQYNSPAVNPRDYTVNVQNQTNQYVDLSGTNAAKAVKSIIQIVNDGSGSGTFTTTITPVNDTPTACAVSVVPLAGTPPLINCGGLLHEAGSDIWAADEGLYRVVDQQAVSYGLPVTNVAGVGLVAGQDEYLLETYRYGFNQVNSHHSLFYDIELTGSQPYVIQVYSFEPSTAGNSVGDRVVEVRINSNLITTVDVLAIAGAQDKAVLYTLQYTPGVSGTYEIEFRGLVSGGNYSPIVCAISIAETTAPTVGALLDQNAEEITDQDLDPITTPVGTPSNATGFEFSPISVDDGTTTSPISSLGAEFSPRSIDFGVLWRESVGTGVETSPITVDSGFTYLIAPATGAEVSPISIDLGASQTVIRADGTETSPASTESGTSSKVDVASGDEISPISVDRGDTIIGANSATGAEVSPISIDSGILVHGTILWVPVIPEKGSVWRPH